VPKQDWLSLDDSPTPEVLLRAAPEDQAIANVLNEVRVLLKRATKERKEVAAIMFEPILIGDRLAE
jgi:hypothetical protein